MTRLKGVVVPDGNVRLPGSLHGRLVHVELAAQLVVVLFHQLEAVVRL